MLRPLLTFLLVLLLVGCERPFVEAVAPTLDLVEPANLDTVRTEPLLPLAFRASSFRSVGRVEVNGSAATYRSDEDVYLDTLRLDIGLNTIRVDAFDTEGAIGTDTLYAVYLPYQFAEINAPTPQPVGGQTATRLRDGTILFTGGIGSDSAPIDAAFQFDPRTFRFTPLEGMLDSGRTGHTASRLDNGRVLLLGGSRRLAPATPSDLVTTAELYDPVTESFTPVPLVDPEDGPVDLIQRTEHTTALLKNTDDQTFLYLYGGIGPRFDGKAVVPIEFMRTLRLEADPLRLVEVGPRERFLFVPISGHTQTPLADVDANGFGRYLVAGVSLPGGGDLRAPFVFDFSPTTINTTNAESLVQQRRDHATASLGESVRGDLVFVTGGRTSDADVLQTAEVFAPAANRSFAFPGALQLRIARWGHTATNLGDGRILLVGGFSGSDDPLDRAELFLIR